MPENFTTVSALSRTPVFFRKPVIEELVAHACFEEAHAVFEFGFGSGKPAERLLSRQLPSDASCAGTDSGHQRFDKTTLSLMTGYIIVEEPSSVTYNDVYLYDIGILPIINRTELYTSFEGRRAMIPGQKNPQEVNVGFFHVLNADYAIKENTFIGLNKGGPDFGLSAGVVRWF
jgi:hypothetical protein